MNFVWGIIALILVGVVFTTFSALGVFSKISTYIGLTNSNFFSVMPSWVGAGLLVLLFALTLSAVISLKKK